jgi:hypothetical protein
MAIVAQCECGKKTQVADVLAGKTIKCTRCGKPMVVPAASGPTPASVAKAKKQSSPAVYVSAGKILAAISALAIAILATLFFVGPYRVWHQWDAIGPKAGDQVSDVVGFALKAYLSTTGAYDPTRSHHIPGVDYPPQFYRPLLNMSMPKKVDFSGKSNQGDYSGKYDTTTGEIEADVAYGGMSIAGLVDLSKSIGKFHITGREVNDGKPEAEMNGTKMTIFYPKHLDDAL